MPFCSDCKEEKGRDFFTKVQLRKADTVRRCKDCIKQQQKQNEVPRHIAAALDKAAERRQGQNQMKSRRNKAKKAEPDDPQKLAERTRYFQPRQPCPPAPLPTSDISLRNDIKAIKELIRHAVPIVLNRGLPSGVGLDGFCQRKLEARFWEVLNNENALWLTYPFLLGLVGGELGNINKRVNFIAPEPHPILHWLVQFNLLRAQLGYCGNEDMVALALRAGASVHEEVSNKCTALFFSMKYSNVRTVELLLDAGAKVDHKDCYGHTVWKNAAERPNSRLIELLLERCNELIPVREFINTTRDCNDLSVSFAWTLPDTMFAYYSLMLPTNDSEGCPVPVSWKILGPPTIDDIAVSLIRVLQAGARFSPPTNHPSDMRAQNLALVTHIDSPCVRIRNAIPQQYEIIRRLRDVIYGRWIPECIGKEIQEINELKSPVDSTCLICLTEMESDDVPITLYCGHRFCLECIKALGKASLSSHQKQKGTDKRCPTCRRLICGDLLTEEYKEQYRSGRRLHFGTDRHAATEIMKTFERGPHLLTDEQLRHECLARNINADASRSDMIDALTPKKMQGRQPFYTNQNGRLQQTASIDMDSHMRVELSATTNLVAGTDNATFFAAPEGGPVVIPIKLKGIPIFASLSPQSFVSVVPRSIVETFGLQVRDITSSQFCSFDGGTVTVSSVVDELKFYLGDLEICLNNAVVLRNERGMVGSIQLGMDFFETSAWTRCSTKLGGCFVITDGGFSMNEFVREERVCPDELRYYSRDGKICRLPFIHIENLAETGKIPIVSIPGPEEAPTRFGECQWCCRYFPCDGMLREEGETPNGERPSYYCDEDCQARGMTIRNGTGDLGLG
mmetsp:Transcript_29075/g.64493  ORF Transcript_29075/g.64493 Transcript_29075/m.64493 type:complete len:849 (-) Transcript_29075:131-2677(-)